jgi:uncharacterized protein
MQVQKEVIQALLGPEAYPEDPGKIELIQTHISYVFLIKNFVYKVKKAVNFGFLDFTTLEKRRFFSEKELQINRRLCPDIYLEVVSINKLNTIKIKGEGDIIEYALKMKRLPQDKLMIKLLKENRVNCDTINKIAEIIAQFHSKAQTSPEISKYGSLETIKINWDENFDQTQKYINKTISGQVFNLIKSRINLFIERNKALMESRKTENRIRDCHGDIHSGNIFIVDKIYIFDAIEFNDRFRYSDVASDIAFLSMDLDFQNRKDLSDFFVKKYIDYSGDQKVETLLPFYKCYRAYVRGKVTSFKLDDPNISNEEKFIATTQAKAFFELASIYARNFF